MKRILVTILAVLYMAGAMGATVHMHYCMNKFAGASLFDDDNDRCGKCGMKEEGRKKGCCKDEHKTFKTSDHQYAKASFDIQHFAVPALVSQPLYPRYTPYTTSVSTNELSQAHAPPSLWRQCPIYIQVCNFRI